MVSECVDPLPGIDAYWEMQAPSAPADLLTAVDVVLIPGTQNLAHERAIARPGAVAGLAAVFEGLTTR